jgi:dienelactone hydrolase
MKVARRSCRVLAASGALLVPLLSSGQALGGTPAADPRVRPGATITLEFPEFGPMFHDRNLTGRVEVYVPADWEPGRKFPLVCWLGGGRGTHRAGILKGITAGRGYVCVALPYRPADESSKVGWVEQDAGWGTSWRHYASILAEVERVVGNVDPERRAVMGFSSGGAAVGSLIKETKEFTDYFWAFGVAGYAVWNRSANHERLEGRPVLMYGGSGDPRMGKWREDKEWYDSRGVDAEVFVYKGHGHVPPPREYRPKIRDWLDRKVARRGLPEAEARMKAAMKAGRWTTALRSAQGILAVATEAMPERAAARAALETISAEGERAIERLLAGSPKADELREFAASWAPCPCAETAREAADPLAEKELDRILAMTGFGRTSKLRAFASDWEGYPVRERALAAYEDEAAEALAALERGFVTARKLKVFVDKWTPAPSAARALEELEGLAAKELDKIMATRSASSRRSRLKSFVRDYGGTRSASRAEDALGAMLEQEAAKVLARIKMRSAREQKTLLAALLKKYAGTRAAEEARKLLDDLSGRN